MTSATSVSEAVASRRSVRGFLSTPVDADVIRRVVEKAARAPSGGNLQPWHVDVVAGPKLDELKTLMAERVMQTPKGEPTKYDIYPRELPSPYRDYRFELGEDMYASIGIPREDKMARLMWFARNFQFFGAPLALFCSVSRSMGPPQWSDLGMYLQTLMLLLREEGLDSCPQECWAIYPETIGQFLNLPDDRMLFCGMSIGFADEADKANQFKAKRAPLEAFATFHGI